MAIPVGNPPVPATVTPAGIGTGTVTPGSGPTSGTWTPGASSQPSSYVYIIDELGNILSDENENLIYSEFVPGQGNVIIVPGDGPTSGSFSPGDVV